MEREKGSGRQGGDGSERVPLSFIDHHRQNYAERVPVPQEGDFMIGAYEEGSELGEFKIELYSLGDRGGRLDPRLSVFGDGAEALSVLLDFVGGDLGPLLRPVSDHEEFSRRLLDLGLRDASHTPLAEGR